MTASPDVAAAVALPVETATDIAEPAAPTGRWARFAALANWVLRRGGAASESGHAQPVDESIDPAQAAELLDTQGYARQAPSFLGQTADETRTNMFTHSRLVGDQWEEELQTEHAGLVGLRDFLRSVTDPTAEAMLDHLTFIGEKEFAEGAAGLAAYWKKLLDDDPELQFCAVLSATPTYDQIKSDAYLREQILQHFTDEELLRYKGRFFLHPKHLTADPAHVRIAMIDDWTISGWQMEDACKHWRAELPEKYWDRLEVQLLAASSRRLASGIKRFTRHPPISLPVRAYFRANETKGGRAFISGTHSSVDFNFNGCLVGMMPDLSVRKFRKLGQPALIYVVRSYRELRYTQAERVRRVTGVYHE